MWEFCFNNFNKTYTKIANYYIRSNKDNEPIRT